MKILLVLPFPRFNKKRWSFNSSNFFSKKGFCPPLSLATVAALTPPEFEVEIWDECVHGHIDEDTRFEDDYAIIGLGGYYNHYDRAIEVATLFRNRGAFLVAGGAGVTSSPKKYVDYFDALILGESEDIWPLFLSDFMKGDHKKVYKATETVDMTFSPRPKWGNLKSIMKDSYTVGTLQTTRGCPFMCEFCTVWKVFGRKMRTKSPEVVIEEIKELLSIGMPDISFSEDNFYGNPKYNKSIVKELIKLNEEINNPPRYYAEISLNVAWDEDVLKMHADAGFAGFFIGIESPSKESLKETHKVQNLKGDLVENCHRVHNYGIVIEASMIVGFDHDDEGIFDMTFEFLQKACLPYPRISMLRALPGTDTYDRLIKQNRVLDYDKLFKPGSPRDITVIPNILTQGMTRIQMFYKYIELTKRLYDWDNFTERMIGYIDLVKYVPAFYQKKAQDSGMGEAQLPEMFKRYILSFSDEKTRECVSKIFYYTIKNAPYQINNAARQIARQSLEVNEIEHTWQLIRDQIEFEKDLDLNECILYPKSVEVFA